MTLSAWLRDYIYIPLGGRGHSESGRAFNLMVTMLIGGLWHGAAWTFVAWGGLHGLALAANHVWAKVRPAMLVDGNPLVRGLYGLGSWVCTFSLVSLLWVIFRANSFADAHTLFARLATTGGHGLSFSLPYLADYFSQDSESFAVWLFRQEYCTAFNLAILLALLFITWFAPNSNW